MQRLNALRLSAVHDTPQMEINTTPLIDVLLVLLVMLIVTLPPVTHAVKMNLPTAGQSAVHRNVVTIVIDFDGSVYWNDTPVASIAEVEQRFSRMASSATQPVIRIDANRHVKYDAVAQVLAAAQRSGMQYVGFAGNERFAY